MIRGSRMALNGPRGSGTTRFRRIVCWCVGILVFSFVSLVEANSILSTLWETNLLSLLTSVSHPIPVTNMERIRWDCQLIGGLSTTPSEYTPGTLWSKVPSDLYSPVETVVFARSGRQGIQFIVCEKRSWNGSGR